MPGSMSASDFPYSPLEDGQIRILELQPGRAGTLSGELRTVSLKDCAPDGNNSFEALSYVWGSGRKLHRFETSNGGVALTESLHRFLLQLRLDDGCRRVWADAVCINQADSIEKARQVSLMGAIFSSAECVVADLGEPSEDTELALQLMDRYWRQAIRKGGHLGVFGRTLSVAETAFFCDMTEEEAVRPSPFEGPGLPPMSDKVWESVKNFFDRAWFSRLWVVQEFVLARDVVLVCGHHRPDWRHLLAIGCAYGTGVPDTIYSYIYSFEDTLLVPSLTIVSAMTFVRRVRMLKQSAAGLSLLQSLTSGRLWQKFTDCHLADMLHYFQHSGATIPLDRYYALQMLSDDFAVEDHPDLAPDYTTESDDAIAIRFGRFLVQGERGVEMFLRSGLWTLPSPGVPSWMQDFARAKNSRWISLTARESEHRAGGDTAFEIALHADQLEVVALRGCLVGEVANLAPAIEGGTELDRIAEYVQAGLMALTSLQGTDVLPLHDDEILVKAAKNISTFTGRIQIADKSLVVGMLCLVVLATLPRGIRSWDAFKTKMHNEGLNDHAGFASTTDDEGQRGLEVFVEELEVPLLQGLRPATTAGGDFANVPGVTVPGDQIWVLHGCRLPVVLRKSERDPSMFRLVGSCYCDGVMAGEVLQRPEGASAFVDVQIH